MVKISVIMPVYNEELFISEAIQSVINQSMRDFEIIIVDDYSNDGTVKIIEKFMEKEKRIKLIKMDKRYPKSKAFNKGIEIARGEYIAFLAGDDLYDKDKLKVQFQFMEKNEKIGATYVKLRLFGEDNRDNIPLEQEGKDLREVLKQRAKEELSNLSVGEFLGLNGAFGGGGLMVRGKIFKGCKFDENLERTEDYDLCFQMIGKGYKFSKINGKALYFYRIHPNQCIRNHKKMNEARDYILKKLKSGAYFK